MPNPVEEYEAAKTAAKAERKKNELQLWQKWKDSGEDPKHLQPLLKLYEPVLAQKVRLWKPKMIPESAYKADLQGHAIKAFKSYDPLRGAALNTHVETRLKKSLRYGNLGANMGYLPEAQSGRIGVIDKAKDQLREELGRDPTYEEISEHMRGLSDKYTHLTPARIKTIEKGRLRDIPASHFETDPTELSHSFEEQQIAVAQHILPDIFPNKPELHKIFNHVFGTNGYEKITSTSALAKKLGRSQPQVSRMKTQMGLVLRKHMGLDEEDED